MTIPLRNGSKTDEVKSPITLDRELPDPFVDQKKNRIYFVVYGLGVVIACAIIFNYEKTRSPITSSTLYFLRRSTIAKEQLGEGINFSSSWPWISGPLNTVSGHIDILFAVKGSKTSGTLLLKANRDSKIVPFNIQHFILQIEENGVKTEYDLTKDPEVDFDI
jgi:cytochrome c oxidase assembly factor 1